VSKRYPLPSKEKLVVGLKLLETKLAKK